MFPVKHTVIYTFFCYNVSPKHLFLQCFQCSGIQKPCKILLCTMFFLFLAVFPLPESYQNDPKFHFNTLLRSDTQKSSKNVGNTTVFWSRCETVFGPPSPAKADIATAILTNVIEHLVLLFCPPISTPSPPKRCGRISDLFLTYFWPKAIWHKLDDICHCIPCIYSIPVSTSPRDGVA